MAKRKINWTEKANFERKEILDYWISAHDKNYKRLKNQFKPLRRIQILRTIKIQINLNVA